MIDRSDDLLDQLVEDVQSNKKYASILPDFIRSIGKSELEKRHNLKEAIKETKSKLHQVTGVYLDGKTDFTTWLYLLKAAAETKDPLILKSGCEQILLQHTSTKERLPYLNDFYQNIFPLMMPFNSVLDIACGLNPLTIPWMGLNQSQQYHAWDVNAGMVEFLSEAVKSFDTNSSIKAVDIFSVNEFPEADLVFLLKTLPCLEQVHKGVAISLLNRIKARNIVISFPSKSLGGVNKGMEQHYARMMQTWLAGGTWNSQTIRFSGELVYILGAP